MNMPATVEKMRDRENQKMRGPIELKGISHDSLRGSRNENKVALLFFFFFFLFFLLFSFFSFSV